jgi:hypothetical protein
MTNELEYELRDALRAQMDATTRLMLDAKFTAQDIMDCTAQAQRVLAMPSQDDRVKFVLHDAAVGEAYKRFPDDIEPINDHPTGKIVVDRGNLRFAFLEGARFLVLAKI